MKKVLTSLMFTLLLLSACTQSKAIDISSIINDRDNYIIETNSYEDEVTFTLSSDKRLEKLEEPIKIAEIYDTTIYVNEIRERNNNDIVVELELENDIHPKKGTVLSITRITDQAVSMTGGIIAYDDEGNSPRQWGTGRNPEKQRMHFDTRKTIYMENDEWTFKIQGLNVLKYEKR